MYIIDAISFNLISINTHGNNILAMCVDRNEIKTNGINYIHNNCKLAQDVFNVLNVMRGRMEELLQVDMNEMGYPNPAVVEEEYDEEQEFRPTPELITQCLDAEKEENETEDQNFMLTVSVLKELSA